MTDTSIYRCIRGRTITASGHLACASHSRSAFLRRIVWRADKPQARRRCVFRDLPRQSRAGFWDEALPLFHRRIKRLHINKKNISHKTSGNICSVFHCTRTMITFILVNHSPAGRRADSFAWKEIIYNCKQPTYNFLYSNEKSWHSFCRTKRRVNR